MGGVCTSGAGTSDPGTSDVGKEADLFLACRPLLPRILRSKDPTGPRLLLLLFRIVGQDILPDLFMLRG
jgi:hypothetical protein